MLKQERQEKLLTLIQQYTFLSIIELASKLSVSEMTIRRDITELANQEKLTKLYGGAQKLDVLDKELTTDEKIQTNVDQKKFTGKIINSLITDNSIIFLGAGTTIFYALPEIQKKNLFVITNSLIAFTYLKDNTDYRCLLIGGEFTNTTEEFVGDISVRAFDNLNIDIAFGATNGISDNNVTTSEFNKGAVQNAAFAKSKTTCIVADSSKLGLSDIYTFSRLEEHDYLITDSDISEKLFQHYSSFTTVLREELS